jgi:hypothetical protein
MYIRKKSIHWAKIYEALKNLSACKGAHKLRPRWLTILFVTARASVALGHGTNCCSWSYSRTDRQWQPWRQTTGQPQQFETRAGRIAERKGCMTNASPPAVADAADADAGFSFQRWERPLFAPKFRRMRIKREIKGKIKGPQ